ncbi:hypothetical protein BCV70DRAFT_197119 [Testicularia cyperi]|uniref:Cora-domain-containing protein n=1 Tax=Testicularia cyperi TaxID=1882483 RepID=A0A317XY76_9BASI|nr:hypothetical protein BCV70DRAFT_197119 [Testicularia cyperi]
MSTRISRKPRARLQFAPEQKRVRKVDLPPSYEAEDTYRHLDNYVEESRARRRVARRDASSKRSRARRGSRSSRASHSSAVSSNASNSSSSSSSDGSSDSSSSSSSSSSGSGHGLTIARLRAFFGDSSSSDSDSSSSTSSSSSNTSRTSASASTTATDAGSRSRRPYARRLSAVSVRKSKSRRSGKTRSRADQSEASDVPGSPVSSRRGPLTPYFAPLADFPLGKKATERRQAKKARQAARRAKQREADLIKQGRLPPKPSRSARAKAMRARELAGGITEYQLFTPMRLPMDVACTRLKTLEPTPEPVSGTSVVYKKTLRTNNWSETRNHFYVLRNYLRQVDPQGGDFGLAPDAAYARPHHHEHHHHHRRKAGKSSAARADASAGVDESGLAHQAHARTSTAAQRSDSRAREADDELDFLDGDLALPPPAMELPDDAEAWVLPPVASSSKLSPVQRSSSRVRVSSTSSQDKMGARARFDHQLPADQEEETRTGRHLSDMPLSPGYSTVFGKDFGRTPRDFLSSPPSSKDISPTPHRRRGRSATVMAVEATSTTIAVSTAVATADMTAISTASQPPGSVSPDHRVSEKSAPPQDPPSEGAKSKSGTAGSIEVSDEGAWWLHVHCPTYRDMHEISKLFPMHPLTVEDVLQQDPREKVDVFDRLGYYFVVIRTIDESYFRYTSTGTKSPTGSPSVNATTASSATASSSSQTAHGSSLDAKGTDSDVGKPADVKLEQGETDRSGQESIEMRELSDQHGRHAEGRPPNDPANIRAARTRGKKDDENAGHNTRLSAPTRMSKGRVEIVERIGGKEGLEGVSVGANNMYLLVFSHGVISFSFEDVSKHIDRVMTRLLEITQPVELTADWIAHDLYDSAVDAFFPLLAFVQSEVVEVEELASEPTSATSSRKKAHNFAPKQRRQRALLGSNPEGRLISVEPVWNTATTTSEAEKRMPMLEVRRLKTVCAFRPLPFLKLHRTGWNRLPRFLVKQKQTVTISRLPEWEFKDRLESEMRQTAAEIDEASNFVFDTQAATDQSIMLHRIADTRKIVTGLSRLLAPKNDAVKGLRKRLADLQQLQRREEAAMGKIGANSRSMLARTEVSMYMSDVHDHIISMLSQLGSDEGRLSEIHHTYLAQITIDNRRFRQGTDGELLFLASIGLTVVTIIFVTSLFSLNVNVPMNEHDSKTHHWWFGILGAAGCVPFLMFFYVKLAWKQSKSRIATKRAAR